MGWIDSISDAIQYIEDHITEELTVDMIAEKVNLSSYYFQKGFTMLCGFTIAEYIRNRRLFLAGNELLEGNAKIIDIAMKYGYDSPDSFTKAFTRFHGVTPSTAFKDKPLLKSFAPLRVKISLEGGFLMDYRFEQKEAFTVVGKPNKVYQQDAYSVIPRMWEDFVRGGGYIGENGIYGVNLLNDNVFEYLIADCYEEGSEIPEDCITVTIPAHTWAIFPCVGALPDALLNVHSSMFSEWLPSLRDYELADGYCLEYYDDPAKYPHSMRDENYYCELWIPVKAK